MAAATTKPPPRHKGISASAYLNKKLGPLTFGRLVRSIRECDELSLEVFAKRLGVTRGRLCDIEQGRCGVSVERAAEWAKKLGYHPAQFVALALQAQVDAAGIRLRVSVDAA
jgi:transcriptional regulator with XRE-family HTH domain